MHKFIENTVLTNAVNAAFATRNPKAPVYAVSTTARDRAAVRSTARTWLSGLGARYVAAEYNLAKYCDEIKALTCHLQRTHAGVLYRKRVAVGLCQKMIGVYLKHLWLMGDPSKKPAAPILDRQVIRRSQVPRSPNWTEIRTFARYRGVVSHVGRHVAEQCREFTDAIEWEAAVWEPENG